MPRAYPMNCRVLLLTFVTVPAIGCLDGEYDNLETDDFYVEDADLSEIDDFMNAELDSESDECQPEQGVHASLDVPLPSCTESGKPYIYNTGSWWQDELYVIGVFGPGLGGIYRVDLETGQKELVFSGIGEAVGKTTVITFTGAGSSHCVLDKGSDPEGLLPE